MAIQQNGKCSGIIGSISEFAGTLVGTAVGTSRRIVDSVRWTSRNRSNQQGDKVTQMEAKGVRKAARKTGAEIEISKTKIKKVAKRKVAGTAKESETSGKNSAESPSKKSSKVPKRKAASPQRRKKTTEKTASGEATGGSQTGRSSELGANANVSTGNDGSEIACSEATLEKSVAERSLKPSISTADLGGQCEDAAAPTLSEPMS